jgi:hypothetical protein
MNRTLRFVFGMAALAALAAGAGTARAADAEGGLPGEWLTGYSGARTLGMGGAFVATADDALGALWNPAGLQRMDRNQLMFENVRLYEETSINSLGFAVPGNWLPSFGLSIVSLRSGEFERTNEMNDALGSFRNSETAYVFTLAKALSPKLAIGTNFKLVQQSVEDFSAGGFGMDVGGIFQLTPTLSVGASALNLGGPKVTLRTTEEEYPSQFRGGFALNVFGGRGTVAAEVDQVNGMAARFHAGAEYWVQGGMALRAGFEGDRATGGFSYRLAPQYQLDYGVADHDLGLSHRVGLSYRFGGFFANSQAMPDLFSPTGERATTQVSLVAHTKAEAKDWSLEFTDKTDQVVRRFGGPGLPPPHVQWDGKDESGLPLADGQYAYRLTVHDAEGRVLTSSTRQVRISTGGPQGDVPVTMDE